MPKKLKTNTTVITQDDVKNKLLTTLNSLAPDSDEFAKVMVQYKTLCEVETKSRPERSKIEPWIAAIGNLAGITTMGLFEKAGNAIFTSKALPTFGNKLR